jgi:hypothetical protein
MTTMNVRDLIYETKEYEGPLNLPGKSIECPECKIFYEASKWSAWDCPCDSCGSHPILLCPERHTFDPYGGDDLDLQVKDDGVDQ